MTTSPLTPISLLIRGLIGIVLVAVALAMVSALLVLLNGVDDPYLGIKLIATNSLVASYSGLALAAAVFIRLRRFRMFMTFVLLACPIAVACWGALIWFDDELRRGADELVAQTGGTATVIAVICLHTAAFGYLETKSSALHWMRWVVIAIAWCFGLLMTTLIWLGEYLDSIASQWLLVMIVFTMAIVGGIGLLGSLLVRIAFRLTSERERARVESVPSGVRLGLVCPGCAEGLSLAPGHGRCDGCGFTVSVEFDEPRCECGYLLFRLEGDQCPECGVVVPREQRWGRAQS